MTSVAAVTPARTNRLGMFLYYLSLGILHLRRNPALTALMVLTLGVGVAASMSTLTILRAMTGDPIPEKSDRLFVPLLDVRPDDGADGDSDPPDQLSYRDTVALVQGARGVRQSGMFRVGPAVDPGRANNPPFFADGLAVHADFFAMIGVRFVAGGPWSKADDDKAANVAVVDQQLADKLVPGGDAVGKTVTIKDKPFTIVGVVADDWEPLPRFYRLIAGPGAFGGDDELLIPFPTAVGLELSNQGQTSCFTDDRGPTWDDFLASDCVWMTLWVELAKPGDRGAYQDYLAGYVAEQRKLGRFPRATNNRLYDVTEWLDVNKVVPKDRRLQTYLAFGFLLVCLVNTIGLLLAKFSARNGEIGVRRALGATRRAVFQQYLIEAGVIGLAGGVVGLGLTYAALWFLGRQAEEAKRLAHLDVTMFAATFAVALTASLLAGLLPTWRASKVTPALQLKAQ